MLAAWNKGWCHLAHIGSGSVPFSAPTAGTDVHGLSLGRNATHLLCVSPTRCCSCYSARLEGWRIVSWPQWPHINGDKMLEACVLGFICLLKSTRWSKSREPSTLVHLITIEWHVKLQILWLWWTVHKKGLNTGHCKYWWLESLLRKIRAGKCW